MKIIHHDNVPKSLRPLWTESRIVFDARNTDEFSFQHEDLAYAAWEHYIHQFEENNNIPCPGCGKKLSAFWCIWYCCCPKKPYGWYCHNCSREWYYETPWILDEDYVLQS